MTPQWISVEEAARRLNLSVSTIRRRIEAGELEAERELIGGSRERYRVRLPEASGEASGAPVPIEAGDAPGVPIDAPAAIVGLLSIIDADRETIAEKDAQIAADASRIADLMHQNGRLEAERDGARQMAEELRSRLTAAEERLQRPWWRFW